MRVLPQIFIILALISLSHSQSESDDEPQQLTPVKLEGIYVKSYKELTKRLEGSRKFLAMVMIGSNTCKQCDMAIKIFESYNQKMKGITNNYFVDCISLWKKEHERPHFPLCDPQNEENWPQLQFFKPPIKDYDPFKPEDSSKNRSPEMLPFHGQVSENRLVKFAELQMPLFALKVNSNRDVRNMLESKLIGSKVLLFFKFEEEVPSFFKALTSHFKGKIMFGYTSDKDVKAAYNITETPTVLIFKYIRSQNKYVQEIYTGPRRISGAKAFFQRLAEPNERKEASSQFQTSDQRKNMTASALHKFSDLQESLNPDQCTLLILFPPTASGNNITNMITLQDLRRVNQYQTFLHNFDQYIDQVLQYTVSKEGDNQESELYKFIEVNKLSIDEEHFLVYPTGVRTVNQFIRITGKETVSLIYQMLENSVDSASVLDTLDVEALGHFIENNINDKRGFFSTVLFTGNSSEIQSRAIINFKFIASQKRFRNCLKFGVFPHTTDELMRSWNFTEIPTIATIISQSQSKELQTSFYNLTGEPQHKSYNLMSDYFSKLCYEREKRIVESPVIVEANTPEKFDQHCGDDKKCFIGLLDFSNIQAKELDWKHFQTLSENYRAKSDFYWVIVDGHCHTSLLKKVKLSSADLPTVVFYDSKKSKYQVLSKREEGQMHFSEMKEFAEYVFSKKNKTPFKKLSEALDIDEKKCPIYESTPKKEKKTDL